MTPPDALGEHAELARRLTDEAAPAGDLDPATRSAVAWALKDLCYAAWSSDPPRAVRAAQALRALCGGATTDVADPALPALADWCEGIACLTRGEMVAAVAVLDRACTGWRRLGQALHAAQTQVPKVMALAVLGRFDEAQACALDTRRELLAGGDDHAAAKVTLNLGSLSMQRDAYAQAAAQYRSAAVLFARVGDREHSIMADVGLADAFGFLGRFDEAQQIYARAIMRADAHQLPVLAAMAAHGQATLALARGRYGEALSGLEKARRAFAALDVPHRRFEVEKNLADAYLEVRLLPEAIALYRQLVASQQGQEAGATLPWTLAQLARAEVLCGNTEAAMATLGRAAGIFDADANVAGQATVALVEAELYAAGGRIADALVAAERAVLGFGAAGQPAMRALACIQQAAAQCAGGAAPAALMACEALLADATLPPQMQVRAQVERALALLALARREEARGALECAIGGFEDLRAALPGDDLRRAFLADGLRPYVERLRLALEDAAAGHEPAGPPQGRIPQCEAQRLPDEPAGPPQGRRPQRDARRYSAESAGAVLQWLERFKARALSERLGRAAHHTSRVDDTPDAIAAPSDGLRERLDWIYRRQQRLVEDQGESPQALREEAARLEQTLLERARRHRLMGAVQERAPGLPGALDIGALQAALGTQRALVEYGVVGDELFALVVTARGMRLHRELAPWGRTVQAVQGLRFQIDTLRAGPAALGPHLPALAARAQRRLTQVHDFVWRPLQADLADCEQLIVVPHGALHGVPFAALGADRQAVVDQHELSMAASASVALQGLARQAGVHAQALVVGDTARLPHVAAELRAVAAALGQAQVLDGAAACVAALQRQAPAADLLHLACHAQFRADSPLYSALHLADGALTAAQVEGMRLKASLVVLSACETALGDAGASDEGVGLVRAFLIAGAARVLGSHWAVDDAGTADFMQRFYGRWCAGDNVGAALRHTQRAVRAERPHPFHWAAFVLHGGC